MEHFSPRMVLTNSDLLKIILTHGASPTIRSNYASLNDSYFISDVPQQFSMYSWPSHIIHAMHINTMINKPTSTFVYGRKTSADINAAKKLLNSSMDARVYMALKSAQRISEFTDLNRLTTPLTVTRSVEKQRRMFEKFDDNFIAAINKELNCFDISKFDVNLT